MQLTPANGTTVSALDLSNTKAEEGLAMAGLVDICNSLVDAPPSYGEDHTLEMDEAYIPPRPRLL